MQNPLSNNTPDKIPLDSRYYGTFTPVDVNPITVSGVITIPLTYYSNPGAVIIISLNIFLLSPVLSILIIEKLLDIISSLSAKYNIPLPF